MFHKLVTVILRWTMGWGMGSWTAAKRVVSCVTLFCITSSVLLWIPFVNKQRKSLVSKLDDTQIDRATAGICWFSLSKELDFRTHCKLSRQLQINRVRLYR